MIRTGKVSIGANSTLDDGTLLARCNESDPLGNAANFLLNSGIQDGDTIQVTGADGTIGGVTVFCMDAASEAVAAAAFRRVSFAAAKSIQAAGKPSRGGPAKAPSASQKKKPRKNSVKSKGGSKSGKGKRG